MNTIIAVIAVVSNFGTFLLTKLFSKNKERLVEKAQEIENMSKLFDAYKKMLDTNAKILAMNDKQSLINNEKIDSLNQQCLENKFEILRLKKIVNAVIMDSCKIRTCKLRQTYEESDINDIIKDVPNIVVDVDKPKTPDNK